MFVVSGAGVDDHGQMVPVRNAEYAAAMQLCRLGAANGIGCGIIAVSGKHDWPCAGRAFADTLPWLAADVGTPGVPRTPILQAIPRPPWWTPAPYTRSV